MLIGIDSRISPELLYCLARMGHGDEIVLADRNFPTHAIASGCVVSTPIEMLGFNAPMVARLVSSLMPLDGFVEYSALRMQLDDDPENMAEVHEDVWDELEPVLPKGGTLSSIDRKDFYVQARNAFAVIQTGERRSYGCFILRKGVLF